MKCTGMFCPMQAGYRVELCEMEDCPYRTEPLTIADHIRFMSDQELVDFLWQFNDNSFENVMPFCKNTVECGEKLDSSDISTEMCKRCLLDKLRQPHRAERIEYG